MKYIEYRLESVRKDLELIYKQLQRWKERPPSKLKSTMIRTANDEIIYLERKRSRLQAKLSHNTEGE